MKKSLLLLLLLSFSFLGFSQGKETKTKNIIHYFDASTTKKIMSTKKFDIKKVKYQKNLYDYFVKLKKSSEVFLVLTDLKGNIKLGMTLNKDIVPIAQSASEDCGVSCYYDISGCENVACTLSKAPACVCSCFCVDDTVNDGLLSAPKETLGPY